MTLLINCPLVLNCLTNELRNKTELSEEQIVEAVGALVDDQETVETKADFLTALSMKGETVREIGGFARELRDRALRPPIDPVTRAGEILDVCGTGGDRLNTFNISTTVALIAASAGVAVAKHGNRAVTSKSGSADVLEALGIPISLGPEEAACSLREHGFAFFFAPDYHPSFRHIAPARRLCAQRGQRTIFNVLGPLLNPARPSAQLIGVPVTGLCEPIGRVLRSLGLRRGMVVSGKVGTAWLDELSILGDNMVVEFREDSEVRARLGLLAGLSFQPACLEDLQGGDKEANGNIIRRLLAGADRGPKRDAVLLNASAALVVAGKAKSMAEGWGLAADLIDSGKATAKLEELAQATPDSTHTR